MSRDYDDYDDFDDFYDYDFGPTRGGAGKWVALFVLIVILIAALGAILVKVYDIVHDALCLGCVLFEQGEVEIGLVGKWIYYIRIQVYRNQSA